MRGTVWLAALLMFAPAIAYAVPGTVDVDLDGTVHTVSYDADGVQVSSMEADTEAVSLIIGVDVDGSPGALEIVFDRIFFDSVRDGVDEPFIIIADAEEFESTETATDTDRTVRVELPFGITEVEIFGLQLDNGRYALAEPEAPAEEEAPPETAPEEAALPNIVGETPEPPAVIEAAPEPDVMEPKPAAPAEGMTDATEDAPAPSSDACGPGTVLKDGVCVLDQTCGPGTILRDGVCVLDAPKRTPVGSTGDLAMGLGAGLAVSFVIAFILWLFGRVGRDRSKS